MVDSWGLFQGVGKSHSLGQCSVCSCLLAGADHHLLAPLNRPQVCPHIEAACCRRVLVVSAGRGEFWRQIITDVSKQPSRDEGDSPSSQDGSGMVWGKIGAEKLNKKFEQYTRDCEICTGETRTCRRCLRNLKYRVADIPNKKWIPKVSEAGIQTDALARTDAAVQTELPSWARRVRMVLTMLCGS